ncbi:MAG: hypothetical protein KAS32_14700 [Candidatus Peribacteraceae bacterium]|nr:hypothetical protein [Candidatus Peribacteraceae bacterium]
MNLVKDATDYELMVALIYFNMGEYPKTNVETIDLTDYKPIELQLLLNEANQYRNLFLQGIPETETYIHTFIKECLVTVLEQR